jgi:hypothetical protein
VVSWVETKGSKLEGLARRLARLYPVNTDNLIDFFKNYVYIKKQNMGWVCSSVFVECMTSMLEAGLYSFL